MVREQYLSIYQKRLKHLNNPVDKLVFLFLYINSDSSFSQKELVFILGISRASFYFSLKYLKFLDLVKENKKGRFVYYQLK